MFPTYTHYRRNDYHNAALSIFSLDRGILTNAGATMLSCRGKLQVLVFGEAFNSGHPLPEEGKHVNSECRHNLSVECSHLYFSSSPTSQEVVFVICSKHLNTAWRDQFTL